MTTLTAKLSSKGQLLIPKELREQLHWEAGIELTLVPTGRGIFLQPSVKKAKHNLADLRGMLKYKGPPISLEELCKPVDLGEVDRNEDNSSLPDEPDAVAAPVGLEKIVILLDGTT